MRHQPVGQVRNPGTPLIGRGPQNEMIRIYLSFPEHCKACGHEAFHPIHITSLREETPYEVQAQILG